MLGKTSVFLIGPMGSGKTAVGRHLSRALGLPFYDSDAAAVRRDRRHHRVDGRPARAQCRRADPARTRRGARHTLGTPRAAEAAHVYCLMAFRRRLRTWTF